MEGGGRDLEKLVDCLTGHANIVEHRHRVLNKWKKLRLHDNAATAGGSYILEIIC